MAYSEDGEHFLKEKAPFLAVPPVPDVNGWRDPFVFKHKNVYNMLLGSGWNDEGHILLYQGDEEFPCKSWAYKGILATTEGDAVLECPFIAELAPNRWILGASWEHQKPIYWIGGFTGERFVATNTTLNILKCREELDIYAPTIVYIEDKPYFWAWVRNTRMLYGPCEIVLNEQGNGIEPIFPVAMKEKKDRGSGLL